MSNKWPSLSIPRERQNIIVPPYRPERNYFDNLVAGLAGDGAEDYQIRQQAKAVLRDYGGEGSARLFNKLHAQRVASRTMHDGYVEMDALKAADRIRYPGEYSEEERLATLHASHARRVDADIRGVSSMTCALPSGQSIVDLLPSLEELQVFLEEKHKGPDRDLYMEIQPDNTESMWLHYLQAAARELKAMASDPALNQKTWLTKKAKENAVEVAAGMERFLDYQRTESNPGSRQNLMHLETYKITSGIAPGLDADSVVLAKIPGQSNRGGDEYRYSSYLFFYKGDDPVAVRIFDYNESFAKNFSNYLADKPPSTGAMAEVDFDKNTVKVVNNKKQNILKSPFGS